MKLADIRTYKTQKFNDKMPMKRNTRCGNDNEIKIRTQCVRAHLFVHAKMLQYENN